MVTSRLFLALLACRLLLTLAASGCDNPLFSKTQWPSSFTRPEYLSTPATWQQDDPPLCPSAPSSACCDSKASSGVSGAYMEYLGYWYQDWMESLDGLVQDTFNDFNPVIQQQKLDYGWSESWGQSANSGVSSDASATSTVSSASYEPEAPDQAEIDAAFSSDPADGVPDSYASIELTKGDYVWYDFWPYGRGKSRSRPGLLQLSNATQTELRHKANDMNGYMMQFSYYSYECQQAFKQHMVGMLCMGCDPGWGDWVQSSGDQITVSISEDSCTALYDSCKSFFRLYQDLPALVTAMTNAVKEALTSDPKYSQLANSLYVSDLEGIVNQKSAALCDGKTECKELLCTSMAAGTSGIFPDKKLIADPAGLGTGKYGRALSSSVVFRLDSDGYDAMAAGEGEASIVIPMMYASAEASPGAATDTATGSRTAPFSDGLDGANALSAAVAFLSIAITA